MNSSGDLQSLCLGLLFILMRDALFRTECITGGRRNRRRNRRGTVESGGDLILLSTVTEFDAAPRPWLYPSLLACVSENRRFPLDGSGWIPALQCNTAHLLGDIGKHQSDITSSGRSQVWDPTWR